MDDQCIYSLGGSNCLTIIGLSVFRGQKAENLELVDDLFFGRANTQVMLTPD